MTLLLNLVAWIAGVHSPVGLDVRRMFAAVLERHDDLAAERILSVGSPQTTPGILDVDASQPQPWLFARVGMLAFGLYALLMLGWDQTGNRTLVPGMILAGSAAMPLTLLVLFFECNVRRNIAVYQVLRLVLVGGVLSLLVSLALYRIADLLRLQALGSGIPALVEESAKLLSLGWLVGNRRWAGPLNGLLFGAAVGAGFAVCETAGMAFRAGLTAGEPAMRELILARGLTAPFTHVVWTGLTAAALWSARGTELFTLRTLGRPGFLRVYVLVLVLHAAWDWNGGGVVGWGGPWEGGGSLLRPLGYVLCAGVAWIGVGGFLQQGLQELSREQAAVRPPYSKLIEPCRDRL